MFSLRFFMPDTRIAKKSIKVLHFFDVWDIINIAKQFK